jgi:hypothetical protein
MAYLTPQDRFQVQMRSMEEPINQDNPVRFLDAFVKHPELSKIGFEVPAVRTRSPCLSPKGVLKTELIWLSQWTA